MSTSTATTSNDHATTATMTAEEAVQRAREIAARLSGQTFVPTVSSSSTSSSHHAIGDTTTTSTAASGTAESNNNVDAVSKKRKRWGIMPATEAPAASSSPTVVVAATTSPNAGVVDFAAEARAKALAAVAKAIAAPSAVGTTVVTKPKPVPVTRRVWVSAMLTDERPAAHFVAYGQRHFVDVLNKLNTTKETDNDGKEKEDPDSMVKIEFKGKGASDKPPVFGMPEEPLHVHIHGPKLLADQAEMQVEDILEQAQTAPIEEDAINARLAAEGALTTTAYTQQPKATSQYRPASVAQLIGQANMPIEQRILMDSSAGIEESIGVPNGIVGYIIGRGGENIATMQAKTGCKVQIQKEHDLKPGQTERIITLQALTQEAIDACRTIIQNMVNDRIKSVTGGSGSSNKTTGSATNTMTSVTSASAVSDTSNKQQQQDPVQSALSQGHKLVEVDVPDADVGLVIGKGGVTIKSIQEHTGATIQVPKTGNVDNPLVRTLFITHPEESGALQAKEMVENVLIKNKPGYREQMLQNQRMPQQQQLVPQQQAQHAQPEVSIQVMIPDNDVGLCIGKQGCVIKYMQNTTRTKIQIPQQVAHPGDTYRIATITGPSMEACNQVRTTIERIVAEQSSASIMAAAAALQNQQASSYDGSMYGGAGGYHHHHSQQQSGGTGYNQHQQYPHQQQSQYNATQQEGYSAEWAQYHAALAAQQMQQTTTTASTTQEGWSTHERQQPAAAATTTDAGSANYGQQQQQNPAPDAYYEEFFRYSYYYGEDAARQHYGAWSPPVGTPNPYGVNPNLSATGAVSVGTAAAASGAIPSASSSTTAASETIASEARETSRRQVSNLPAWMTKK